MEGKTHKASGYSYTRSWFDYTIENPDKIAPVHTALHLWIVELNNRLGWKDKFSLPTAYSMQAIGIKNWRTYKKALDDLIEWGFVRLISKSKNQYTANVVALVKNTIASQKHIQQQDSSTAHIDKQYKPFETNINNTNFLSEKVNFVFSSFLQQEELKGHVSEARRKVLIENLNKIAPDDDDCKIAIIKQAIAGNYPDFRPLPSTSKTVKTGLSQPMPTFNNIKPHPDGLTPPTEQEVFDFFEQHGQPRSTADNAYFNFDHAQWRDKGGNSMIKDWKKIAEAKFFKPVNKNED